MPPSVRTLRYTQRELHFDGGLNTLDPPTEIADNELVTCKNFLYNGSRLVKRPGFYKVLSSAFGAVPPPWFILGYDINNSFYVAAAPSGSLIKFDLSGGTATGIAGAWAGTAMWMQSLAGVTYVGFDSATGVRALTGAGISAVAIANSGFSNVATFHQSRIFQNVQGNNRRIAFSDTPPYLTYTATNTIDIGPEDNDEITALASLGDNLLIFKKSSTWILFTPVGATPATWSYRKINGAIGAAPRAVYSYNNEIYFVSNLGFYKTNGTSFVELSKKAWDTGDPIFSSFGFSFYGTVRPNWRIARLDKTLIVVGRYTRSAFVPPVSYGYTYTFNLDTGAWTKWDFLGNTGGFDDVFSDGNNILVSRDTNFYVSLRDDVYSYDAAIAVGVNPYADGFIVNGLGTGAAYTSQFTSKEMSSFNDWMWRIKWASLEYISRTPGPTFNMIGDGSARATVTPGFHATLRKAYKIAGAGRVRQFQLNCSHALTSPFEFYRGEFHFGLKTHISSSGTP